MATSATTAPVGSVTKPEIEPVNSWPKALAVPDKANIQPLPHRVKPQIVARAATAAA